MAGIGAEGSDLQTLKRRVCAANRLLPAHGLVKFTWGNVSGLDRAGGRVVIKPSGVAYDDLRPENMAVVDLGTGRHLEGGKPSSDTETHLALYRRWPKVGGIVHTHSRWATIWAQAGCAMPPLGTTHADYFHGAVPCTRPLTPTEIRSDYEAETGKVIVETVAKPDTVPAVLVVSHGPFTWGADAAEAVHNAVVLEEAAHMAWHTLHLNAEAQLQPALLNVHYNRKHGPGATYGQPGGEGD